MEVEVEVDGEVEGGCERDGGDLVRVQPVGARERQGDVVEEVEERRERVVWREANMIVSSSVVVVDVVFREGECELSVVSSAMAASVGAEVRVRGWRG